MTRIKLIEGDIVIFENKEPQVVIGRSIQDGESVMLASIASSPLGKYTSYESINPTNMTYKLGEVNKALTQEDYDYLRNGDHGTVMLYF